MSGYIPNNTINTPKTYQTTLKHKLSIAYDGVPGTGAVCKHVELDSTYTLLAYEEADSDIGVMLGTKDGIACITWGTPVILTGTYTLEDFVALSTTSALLIMRESGGNISTAVVSFSAPTTITINAAVNSALDADTTSIKGCFINTGKVILSYRDTSDTYPKAAVCTITGTTPSYGTPTTAKVAAVTNATSISVCMLTTTAFFMTYDNGTNTYGHILSFNGNATITINTESQMLAALTTYCSCALLDSTHVVVSFTESIDTSIVAIISTTTISSWGTKVTGIGANQTGQVVAFSSTKFGYIATYTASRLCKAIVGNITSGTTIVFGAVADLPQPATNGNGKIGMIRILNSTHMSYVTLDASTTSRRLYYGVLTTYGISSVLLNEMTNKLTTCGTGKEIYISLLGLISSTSSYTANIYLGGNDWTNKGFPLEQYIATAAGTDTEYGKGILILPNSPISLVSGQSIYVGCGLDSLGQTMVVTTIGSEKIL